MFRSKKCWKELTWFFQQHKLIVSICVISALLIAKASTLPVWGWLPHSIQQYLLAPKGGSDEWEIYSILSNLSFAYISSIITYILIQYIPERRKAIKAFVTLRSDLEQIYSSMSRLISMFLFDMQIDKSESQIILSDVVEMKHMYITNECKMCEIHPYRNGVDQRTVSEDYNLHKDSHIFSEGPRLRRVRGQPLHRHPRPAHVEGAHRPHRLLQRVHQALQRDPPAGENVRGQLLQGYVRHRPGRDEHRPRGVLLCRVPLPPGAA